VETALGWLRPRPGERAVDLYAGVGLFAAALAEAVGESGAVLAVEAEGPAIAHAEANLAAYGWVEVRSGRVERVLRPLVRQGVRADLVVLDPPRTGAGRAVVSQVAALQPRAVVYVACDPAALARDTAYLRDEGYRLQALRAFDAFPMTHHVECVALFEQETP
jgi:tRNA/tmRNA/rRNA uracil-C5-methylase (TrmA/RlmC/RlmD family)